LVLHGPFVISVAQERADARVPIEVAAGFHNLDRGVLLRGAGGESFAQIDLPSLRAVVGACGPLARTHMLR
jgi:hypothetical protein